MVANNNISEIMPRIFVLGASNHHNTLSMIRCLGFEGFAVELVIVGSTVGCAAKSKYVNHLWILDNNSEIIPFLIEECHKEDGGVVIISCDDTTASLLDDHANEFDENCIFFHTDKQGDLSLYMNKLNQVVLARQIGFQVPDSVIYEEDKQIEDFDSYPCIIKPLESIHGGKKIEICTNETELKKRLRDFSSGDRLLIQQFVNREKELVVLGLSTKSEIIIGAVIEKIRDNKGGTTFSKVCAKECLPSEIVAYSKEMIKRIGYHGLFGIELIKSDGKLYFVEINLRNDATCYSLAKAGINLPVIWVKDALKMKLPNMDEYTVREIYSMVELKDFKSLLKGKVTPWRWLQQLYHSECLYYYDSHDIKPFLYAVLEIVSRPFYRIVS